MASRKPTSRVVPAKPASNPPPNPPPSKAQLADTFPFAKYTSVTGVHTSLLLFTAVFLPQTSLSSILTRSLPEPKGSAGERDVLRILTENPPRTIAWICLGTLILQVWWASWVRGWLLDTRFKRGADRTDEKLRRKEWNSGKLLALWQACICTGFVSVAFYTLSILFGGPLTSHPLHTYLLALEVSLLTVFTPSFTYGIPSFKSDTESLVHRMTWIRLFAELSPRSPIERALVYPTIACFLGCWAGAIPIGLDWERPWQAWPLTPAYGAITGYILGSLWALAANGVQSLATLDKNSQTASSSALTQEAPRYKKSKAS